MSLINSSICDILNGAHTTKRRERKKAAIACQRLDNLFSLCTFGKKNLYSRMLKFYELSTTRGTRHFLVGGDLCGRC